MGRIFTKRPLDSVFPDKVSDLIYWSTWSCDYDLISSTFWPVDVHNILQLSFGSPNTEDRLVWAFSNTSRFTVRHHMLNGKLRMEDGPRSSLSLSNLR